MECYFPMKRRQTKSPALTAKTRGPHHMSAARHTPRSPDLRELRLGCGDNVRGSKAKFVLQGLERRRRPKGLHANGVAAAADIARPAQRGGLFHRDARRHRRWQHVLAILRMLATVVLEDLPRGHADHAGLDALGLE